LIEPYKESLTFICQKAWHARAGAVPRKLTNGLGHWHMAQTAKSKQVKALTQRLLAAGITSLGEAQAQYALSWYPEDLDKAYEVLLLANDSFEGILKDYDPKVEMLGAINRNMVTCYLDALLFAMFARLDSFEAMLFDNFSDEPRKKLAGVLRLWVNLLRTGRLIRVDLVSLVHFLTNEPVSRKLCYTGS
jgi:hypothetical protein